MISMSPTIFYSHYGLDTVPPATHLCYEVYDQNVCIDSGHLTNTGEAHAEEVFLGERFQDAWKQCTVVWYISWSPCDDCLQILLNTFLPNNPYVKLHIIFAKVHKLTSKIRVRQLKDKGVKIRAMSQPDFRWCWNHFVDITSPFVPWQHLNRNYWWTFKWLQNTLYSD